MSKRRGNTELAGGCLFAVLWVLFGVSVGAWLFDYVLFTFTGKAVPWIADALGGAVCSGFLVPLSIITWILTLCGVPTPFFHFGG